MRLGWGLSSPAPDAVQQECCEPRSTLLCLGLFSRFFVQALPCTAEGTLCRVRDTRSLVPRAYGTNRSNSNTSCSSAKTRFALLPGHDEFYQSWPMPPRSSGQRLLIQPDFLEPQAVVLAVVVRGVIPDIGLPAIGGHAGDDDRARRVVDQKTLDIPDDFPAFVLVQFAGLRGQQSVHLGVAVLCIVAL